jgi:hypothetical protein
MQSGAQEASMKIMLLAGAIALLLGGGAVAKDNITGVHAHKVYKTKSARALRRPVMPPKDPYADYWNDPSRQAPPFSYFRGG